MNIQRFSKKAISIAMALMLSIGVFAVTPMTAHASGSSVVDLGITVEATNYTPTIGDSVIITIEITNYGSYSSDNVRVSFLLPPGVSYVSKSEASYDLTTGLWEVGTVLPAETKTLEVDAVMSAAGTINCTATISGSSTTDPVPSNDSDSVTLNCTAYTAGTYVLTVTNGTGGSSYAPDTPVSIVANTAPTGKVFDKWISYNGGTFDNENNASTIFTMPAIDVTVEATYKDVYTVQTLTHIPTGVSAKGLFTTGASLDVKSVSLHAAGGCDACDEIRARQAANELVVLYDISVIGSYQGDITVSIPVGTQHIGKTATFYHCASGTLEKVTAIVDSNGNAVGTFSSFSPFAVSVANPVAGSTLPQTGDPSNILLWLTLAIISMGCIGAVRFRKRSVL